MVVSSALILMTAKPCFSQLRVVVILAENVALKYKLSVLNASGPLVKNSKCTSMFAMPNINALISHTMSTITRTSC